jgi:hypothetical protein
MRKSLNHPLEIRERDGFYQVENQFGKWIRCENKAEAEALARIPLLVDEACCVSNFGKGFAPRFDEAAKLLRKYRMRSYARWFENRAKYFRQHEPQPY